MKQTFNLGIFVGEYKPTQIMENNPNVVKDLKNNHGDWAAYIIKDLTPYQRRVAWNELYGYLQDIIKEHNYGADDQFFDYIPDLLEQLDQLVAFDAYEAGQNSNIDPEDYYEAHTTFHKDLIDNMDEDDEDAYEGQFEKDDYEYVLNIANNL